jgi:hypothetical protein
MWHQRVESERYLSVSVCRNCNISMTYSANLNTLGAARKSLQNITSYYIRKGKCVEQTTTRNRKIGIQSRYCAQWFTLCFARAQ